MKVGSMQNEDDLEVVQELRECLMEGEDTSQALSRIARAYGMPSERLRRRFRDLEGGIEVENYPEYLASSAEHKANRSLALERDKKVAKAFGLASLRWYRLPQVIRSAYPGPPYARQRLVHDNAEYKIVYAYDAQGAAEVVGVNIRSCESKVWRGEEASEIVNKLAGG